MSNYWPLRGKRLGVTVMATVCALVLLSAMPAWAAEEATEENAAATAGPPAVGASQVTAESDTQAKLVFEVSPNGGKDLKVEVYYGKTDVGEVQANWDHHTVEVVKEQSKGSNYFTTTLEKLQPETTYFYRVFAVNSVGQTWSEASDLTTLEPPTPWYVKLGLFLGFLAIFIVPFWFGGWFTRRIRMPEYGWKVGLILFSLIAGLAIITTGWPPKLGIDLSGGVILVYELDEQAAKLDQAKETVPVDQEKEEADKDGEKKDEKKAETEKKKVDMTKLITALELRVNPGGQREVSIRQYGPKQIEITIPRASEDEVRRLEKNVSRAGTLEFRILANNRDHKSLIELARQSKSNQVLSEDGKELLAWWVPVRIGREQNFNTYHEIATRQVKRGDREVTEILVVNDVFNVTGGYLSNTTPGIDRYGRPCVNFSFNAAGARRFGGLTGDNLPTGVNKEFTRKLGIVLDGYLYSAPSIQSTIYERGEITGTFTQQEVEDLVDVLNAGSLPAALKKNPISKLSTGPTLGADTIQRGQWAILGSLIAVLIFMLIYYRFAGLVACGALLANLILLFAIMIAVKADFTLPGLAGLVLTVGMAVDANVLIFERIREELAKNAALRMAIRNGFARATTTIVDANLTTLITAIVLWVVGTPQIKGFAVVLILGVLLSMFTAIFCARVVFDIGERKRWIKKLTMMRILRKTDIDFIGLQKAGAVFSILLIVIGLVCVGARGKGILDIDFTGGESVEILFEEPVKIAEVRKNLGELRDLAVSDVQITGEQPGVRFIINTSEQIDPNDPKNEGKSATDVIEAQIHSIFGEKLATNKLTKFSVTPVSGGAAIKSETPAPAAVPATETKPEASKPAEETKPKTEAPQSDAQSRNDLPPSSLVASTDLSVLFLGQAEATGVKIDLDFLRPLDYEHIEGLVQGILKQQNLTAVTFEVTNDDYVPGDTKGYDHWVLSINLPEADADAKLIKPLEKQLATAPFFPSSSSIGGRVASDMQEKAILALLGSLICIIGYLWIRFQRVMFGLAAVVALVHDVLITVGAIAASAYLAHVLGFLMIDEFKISLSVLAAFLTIIGYSLNDTIVVFDRIREVKGKSPNLTADMINTSINQTLSRTLLTSITTLIGVVILYFAGGQGIHSFAFALMVGVIIGTYSSIFIASPSLLWMSHSKALGTGPVPVQNGNGKKK